MNTESEKATNSKVTPEDCRSLRGDDNIRPCPAIMHDIIDFDMSNCREHAASNARARAQVRKNQLIDLGRAGAGRAQRQPCSVGVNRTQDTFHFKLHDAWTKQWHTHRETPRVSAWPERLPCVS